MQGRGIRWMLYALKTDLPKEVASKETIHERYKGLSEVEWAFRCQDAKDRISSSKAYICA